jgi:hypothetical protein
MPVCYSGNKKNCKGRRALFGIDMTELRRQTGGDLMMKTPLDG